MKLMTDFISRFGASVHFDEKFMVEEENRFFLLNANLKKLAMEGFFYAGTYLGKVKNDRFFPSFPLLSMIAEGKANKVIVDKKTEWLFICGRDVFKQGTTKVVGSKKKGAYTLVMNQYDECLGFGRITADLDETERGVAVKNISDVGDFLRREKTR
jgi:ribosome biogenesis protein Nip4